MVNRESSSPLPSRPTPSPTTVPHAVHRKKHGSRAAGSEASREPRTSFRPETVLALGRQCLAAASAPRSTDEHVQALGFISCEAVNEASAAGMKISRMHLVANARPERLTFPRARTRGAEAGAAAPGMRMEGARPLATRGGTRRRGRPRQAWGRRGRRCRGRSRWRCRRRRPRGC